MCLLLFISVDCIVPCYVTIYINTIIYDALGTPPYSYLIFIALPLSPEMFSLRFLHSTFNTNHFPPQHTRTDPVAAGVACDVSGQLRGCQYGRPSSMPSSASAASVTSARGLRNEIDIIVESRRVERSRRAAGRHAARGPAASRSSLARTASSTSSQAMGWFDRIRPRKTPTPSLLFWATLCCISSVLTHQDKGMRGNGIVLSNFSLPCLDFREAH